MGDEITGKKLTEITVELTEFDPDDIIYVVSNVATDPISNKAKISEFLSYFAGEHDHSYTYTDISGNDANTDVTGAELETLTDGSNADLLHVHAANGGYETTEFTECLSGELSTIIDLGAITDDGSDYKIEGTYRTISATPELEIRNLNSRAESGDIGIDYWYKDGNDGKLKVAISNNTQTDYEVKIWFTK